MPKKVGKCCIEAGAFDAKTLHSDYMEAALAVEPAPDSIQQKLNAALVSIPGGFFEMGARVTKFAGDQDSPRRRVRLSPFKMSATTVSNAEFAAFIACSGYRTVAESEGWSYVFHLLLDKPELWPQSPPGLNWWKRVDGAYWAAPFGPGSDWQDIKDHPAVHISWFDALAYSQWAGLRLPREAEWERAARGGLVRQKFPWGNILVPNGDYAMNTWQGEFPKTNNAADGFVGTAPVRSFAPNTYGMFNMTGNVWEWVADYFGPLPQSGRLPMTDPVGAAEGYERVQRGGSFLCHASYCDRYHVHSRTKCDPDSSTSNAGFRVAADADAPT